MIELVRLTQIALDDVLRLLNEPRNARHMPLAGAFDEELAARWVAAKDAQWDEHGYGPWAVLLDGAFAGWAGFQREDPSTGSGNSMDADFALVLLPAFWGRGSEITHAALDRGFAELGLESVVIALPFTRSPTRAVARLGFEPDGDVTYGGASFRRYRLTRERWRHATPAP